MENTKIKSSVNVVLLALGLLGLAGQALAATPSSYTCFKPKPSEKITIDQLQSKLGSSFYTHGFIVIGTEAERVFWQLESTMDKNKADAILKQYSVQQLLDLNTWTVDECTDEALEKRRQQCDSFCSRKQTAEYDPPQELIEINHLEAFTKHNLGGYCWAIVDDMQNNCPFRQLDHRLSKEKLDSAWAVFKKTRRIDFMSAVPVYTLEGTKKRMAKYLKKQGPVKSAELWNSCSIVVDIFDAPRSYEFEVSPDWFQFVQACKQFTTGFTPDGHIKDDLKGAQTN